MSYRAMKNPERAERMLRNRASRNDPKRVRNWCLILLALMVGIWIAGAYSFVGYMLTFILAFGLMRLLFVAHRWHDRVRIEWENRAYEPLS